MTLAELREACQHRIAEVTSTFFEPHMWRAWLNQAQTEFARETKIIQRRAITITVPGQQSYPIDPDFFMVNVVRFGNHPVLKPITPYELESRPLDQGIPTHYLVVGRELLLWPTPSTAEELVAWYYATPEDMVQDSDEPEIPRVYHPALIPGACYRALRADKDYPGADRMEAEWRQEIQAAIRQQREQVEQFSTVRDAANLEGEYLSPWLE